MQLIKDLNKMRHFCRREQKRGRLETNILFSVTRGERAILVTARSHVLESHGKIFTTSADTCLNLWPIFVPVIDFAKKSLSNSAGNGILKEKNAQKLSWQVLNYKAYVLLII